MRYCFISIALFLLWDTNSFSFPLLPFIQKTENGKIECHAYPFDVYNGLSDLGETLVYKKGKLLYKIDKYISTPFFTTESGRFFIELFPKVYYRHYPVEEDELGNKTQKPPVYDGTVFNVYQNGKLVHSIKYSDLNIDTFKLIFNRKLDWFNWMYQKNVNAISKFPITYHGDSLFIVTIDEQLIVVSISKGVILNRSQFNSVSKKSIVWRTLSDERKYQQPKYPSELFLPRLKGKISIEKSLAKLLHAKEFLKSRDNSTIELYVSKLFINKKGKCLDVDVYLKKRLPVGNGYSYKEDKALKNTIEKWLKSQYYETVTIPGGFAKYLYNDLVYFK